MTRITLGLGLALIAILLAPQSAHAQAGFFMGSSDNPVGPTVSPYLNLLQQDIDPTAPTNYQSLVRPLINQGNAIRYQGNSINRLQQQVNSPGYGGGGGGGGTGHATFFMNYLHYYPSATGR